MCLCVAGVGGLGPGGFRDVNGEASDICTGLGEKFQSTENKRERVRTSAKVHTTDQKSNTNKYI